MGTFGCSKIIGRVGTKKYTPVLEGLGKKSSWRLITTYSLWTKVVTQKYIIPDLVEEWIRRPTKETSNFSIIWKELIKYFQVVGEGLAWHVGKGTRVILGTDPWLGSGRNHIFPKN
jgi:hypothetical protein